MQTDRRVSAGTICFQRIFCLCRRCNPISDSKSELHSPSSLPTLLCGRGPFVLHYSLLVPCCKLINGIIFFYPNRPSHVSCSRSPGITLRWRRSRPPGPTPTRPATATTSSRRRTTSCSASPRWVHIMIMLTKTISHVKCVQKAVTVGYIYHMCVLSCS